MGSASVAVNASPVRLVSVDSSSFIRMANVVPVGMFSIRAAAAVSEIWALLTSTIGDSPETVTVSVSRSICSLLSTASEAPAVSWMPSRVTFWKPGISKVTEYRPGGSAGKR